MTRPTGVISNRLKTGWPALRAMSLTSRLVEVPIRVSRPPNTVTWLSGIRNRLGDSFSDRAMSRTTGAARTTTGVLFKKPPTEPHRPITAQMPTAPNR
ncbi:hypothetical protein D3C75_1063400 [compost metagenome]